MYLFTVQPNKIRPSIITATSAGLNKKRVNWLRSWRFQFLTCSSSSNSSVQLLLLVALLPNKIKIKNHSLPQNKYDAFPVTAPQQKQHSSFNCEAAALQENNIHG